MKVKIKKVSTEELTEALITEGNKIELPSIQTGWRFNFDKLSKKLKQAITYILTAAETPDTIEGCMIFQLIDGAIPYMAYLEVAPHNKTNPKRYDYVAGCLIAFAFKLAVLKGKGDFKAQLFFDVSEKTDEQQEKLIDLYRKKYGALRLSETRLVIIDAGGYALIDKYLDGT